MADFDLAKIGAFEAKLGVNVNASVLHLTPDAARAQIAIAQARHVDPIRVLMRYLAAIVGSLLVFMLVVLVLAITFKVSDALAVAMMVVAGATVAAPLGILLSRMAKQMFPALPDAPISKIDGGDAGG